MRDVSSILTVNEALEMTYLGSGIPAKELAGRLVQPPRYPEGLSYAHFMRMFQENDRLNFPPELLVPLMRECRSTLPLEWLAHRMGYALHEQSLGEILKTIRDAMVEIGQAPKFLICENGRMEAVR